SGPAAPASTASRSRSAPPPATATTAPTASSGYGGGGGGGYGQPFEWEAATRPHASEAGLEDALNALYQPTDTNPGGTAAALRDELATGYLTGGRSHIQKA